ncbi:MAG: ROK family protein [Anaerolineales bacterium]
MIAKRNIYLGTDSGATTSKTGGVWEDGKTISTKLLQNPTNSQAGPQAVIDGWVEGIGKYLAQNDLGWDQVKGVGLALPGVFSRYGVLSRAANMPKEFEEWEVYNAYSAALAKQAGRAIPVSVGNDGNYGGVAEAQRVRGRGKGSVLMLAPGSGLGCAYIDGNGLPLDGDTLSGMEASHMAAPLQLLGVPAYPCGCGRDWGCIEVYTTLSGIPHLLADKLKKYPDHDLAKSSASPKEKAFALRGLAQKGDPLAVELFDFQARAMGLLTANLVLALDPQHVVIGGGLMDPEATSDGFRARYLKILKETAIPYLWPAQQKTINIVPATLGELSQAIGAALVALYKNIR